MIWECIRRDESGDPEGRSSITETEKEKKYAGVTVGQTKTEIKGVETRQEYVCLILVTETETRRKRADIINGVRSDLRGSCDVMERKVAMGTFHNGHPAQILELGPRVDRQM